MHSSAEYPAEDLLGVHVSEGWVGLAEAIAQLRWELTAALDAADGERLTFEFGPVELEFTVDMRKDGSVDAGIRWGVVSFGGKGELSAGSGHRVKLILQPKVSATGRDPAVSTERLELPQ